MTGAEPGPDFKTSKRFGLIGVAVVAVLSAAIALLFGSNSARPTGALIAILALVFGYVFCLLALQRRDADRAEARGRSSGLAAAGPVDDPTTVDTNALLAALAVKPIDHAALAAATGRTWGMARGSLRSAGILMVLIFCAVVPWQLFTASWSIAIFVPIIIGYTVFLAVRAIGAGGQLDQAYADSAATLEPLGLRMTERPQVVIRRRLGSPGGQADLDGALAYAGERHGRPVAIRIEGSDATTRLAGAVPGFSVAAKGERLRAADGAPEAVAEALAPLRASTYWKGVAVSGGSDGIVVERKRDGGLHWMRDLWLAERLAQAAGAKPARG